MSEVVTQRISNVLAAFESELVDGAPSFRSIWISRAFAFCRSEIATRLPEVIEEPLV